MSILAWLALGITVGIGAGLALNLRGRSLVGSTVVAILGAIIGGFVASALLGLDIISLNVTSALVAIVGAAALVLLFRSLPASDQVFD